MRSSLAASTVRTEANTLRSDLADIRGVSHLARMGANSVGRDAFEAVASALRRSQKELAISVGIPQSSLSDALKANGRHLSVDWILEQDDAFVSAWIDEVSRRKGLTPESRREERAARIGELVRLLIEEAA